jgi:molybdopterin-guanine dinucleotide biosynthesis protein A
MATRRAETTGIVLAGGRSSRFGRDKLAEPYRGAPLFHHAVRRLGEVCAEVVVVLAPDAPEPDVPADVPVRFARDGVPARGPLAGTLAGLMSVRTRLALVAGGDMPHLDAGVLREMVRVAEPEAVEAVALGDGNRFRPLPCVLRASAAAENARELLAAGRDSLRDLLGSMAVEVIGEPAWHAIDPGGRTLLDVDLPSDLAE